LLSYNYFYLENIYSFLLVALKLYFYPLGAYNKGFTIFFEEYFCPGLIAVC